MAKKDQRLTLRGNTWYVRVKVPAALRSAGLINVREFKKSLATSDFAEARRLLPLELVWIDAEIAKARRKLNAKPVQSLSRSEMRLMAVDLFHSREGKRFNAKGGGLDAPTRAEVGNELEDWLDALKDVEDDEARNVIDNAARNLLRDNGVELDTTSPQWREFHGLIRRVYIEETRRTLREHRQDFTASPGDDLFEGVDGRKPLPPKIATVTLSDHITDFRKEPSQKALSPKSKGKNVARDRLFREFFGDDKPVAEITRQDVASLVKLLSRLPANATKTWPKATAREAADAAEAKGIEPMTRLTVKGLSVGTDGISNRDRKRPFGPEQLKLIFSAPLFTGCQDDGYGYAKPGIERPRRGRFWVPIIALLHGLRMGEACQLHWNDIADLDGVTVILIRKSIEDKDNSEDDIEKRVKTAAGQRFVPLHPEMTKLGFPEYVAQMRKSGKQRLFPELTAAKTTGYLSDNFSKWFANFLEKAGAKRERTTFHSFRHNYRDALREADISGERVRALGGWAGKETSDDYGGGLKPSTLAADMAKVRLPVDLSHLHQPQPGAGE